MADAVGHAASDPARYLPVGEKEAWLERDPLLVASRALIDLGLSEADVAAARRRASAIVDGALAAALAAEPARPDVAARGMGRWDRNMANLISYRKAEYLLCPITFKQLRACRARASCHVTTWSRLSSSPRN